MSAVAGNVVQMQIALLNSINASHAHREMLESSQSSGGGSGEGDESGVLNVIQFSKGGVAYLFSWGRNLSVFGVPPEAFSKAFPSLNPAQIHSGFSIRNMYTGFSLVRHSKFEGQSMYWGPK